MTKATKKLTAEEAIQNNRKMYTKYEKLRNRKSLAKLTAITNIHEITKN